MATTAPNPTGLTALARSRPEWQPWLAVLDAAVAATRDPAWPAALPEAPPGAGENMPVLAHGAFTVGARLLRRWMRSLLKTAACAGGAATSLGPAARADVDRLAGILEAGLRQDNDRVASLAETLEADAGALGAVAAVAPIPLLRAGGTRWAARIPPRWDQGFCPMCGAWPTFAEARGLERTRHLRCGRCATDWQTAWLRCVYCGVDDHRRLGSLVVTVAAEPEASDPCAPRLARVATTVETCDVCRGYLKTVTTLAPASPDDLGLVDLATVELDVAALEHGYARPAGPGVALGASLVIAVGQRLAEWWWS